MKLVLLESGSAEMTDLEASAAVLVSAGIAYVELRSALAAAYRDRRLLPPEFAAAKNQVERVWAATSRLGVDATLIQQAGDLAEGDELRGYDAVHLAALVRLGPPEVVDSFACWDQALRTAAGNRGYRLFPS